MRLSFRWPMMPGTVITQAAADSQVGQQVHVGGPSPARRGTIVAATVVDGGTAVDLTLELPDEEQA
jgi:hypothetical protein